MKQLIIENIDNSENLEKLYRDNKSDFGKSFAEISDDFDSELVKFWKVRLASETQIEPAGFMKLDLIIVVVLSLITGLLAKLPTIFPVINEDFFYSRDAAIIVFNGIILFVFWQNKIFQLKKILIYSATVIVLLLFVNLLPNQDSDSLLLVFIHTPLFLWCLFGLAYISFDFNNTAKRIEFIRFNGELLIMTGLILIAGGLLTAITVGLFSVIKYEVSEFYMEFIVIFGGVAAPIVSFYLIKLYPNITSKIAPVIARVFTPLVLITLIIYLISLIFSEAKILDDRDLLIVFNALLLVVMAIIVFSVTELEKAKAKNNNVLILFLLAVLTIVINTIALVAIISRVSNGFTPNRTVVLFSNILIFINLILITRDLFRAYFKAEKLDVVEATVAKYLTVYAVYTIFVIFILPFIFNFN
jgi:hypothetical protein